MKIDSNEYRNKSGIYCIINSINNKRYIGSSVNIYQRFYTYICLAKQNKIHNKHLQSAVNKYGIDNFKFDILELVKFPINKNTNSKMFELQDLEQNYIDKLKPEYNQRILVDRNTSLPCSISTRKKISNSLKSAFKNGTKKVKKIQKHSIKVTIFDLKGNHIKDFNTLQECADYIGVSPVSINYGIKSKRRVIKNFITLKKEESDKILEYIDIPLNKNTSGKSVQILDIANNSVNTFENAKLCSIFVGCKAETVKRCFDNNRLLKKKYKIIKYG